MHHHQDHTPHTHQVNIQEKAKIHSIKSPEEARQGDPSKMVKIETSQTGTPGKMVKIVTSQTGTPGEAINVDNHTQEIPDQGVHMKGKKPTKKLNVHHKSLRKPYNWRKKSILKVVMRKCSHKNLIPLTKSMHRLTRPENRGIMEKTDLETGIEEEGEEEVLKGAKMRGDLQGG